MRNTKSPTYSPSRRAMPECWFIAPARRWRLTWSLLSKRPPDEGAPNTHGTGIGGVGARPPGPPGIGAGRPAQPPGGPRPPPGWPDAAAAPARVPAPEGVVGRP